MSWILLGSYTATGSEISITIGSGGTLSQGYKSLRVLCSFRGNSNFNDMFMTVNGSTSGYANYIVLGNGTSATSSSAVSNAARIGVSDGTSQTANTFSSHAVDIPNYAGSTYKTISADSVAETNATTAYQVLAGSLWSNSAAITSVTLADSGGTTVQSGTTVTVYGLK